MKRLSSIQCSCHNLCTFPFYCSELWVIKAICLMILAYNVSEVCLKIWQTQSNVLYAWITVTKRNHFWSTWPLRQLNDFSDDLRNSINFRQGAPDIKWDKWRASNVQFFFFQPLFVRGILKGILKNNEDIVAEIGKTIKQCIIVFD